MGCGSSKEDAEGAVARCREQKHLLRASVAAQRALAKAHVGHASALRNVGAALSDYASGEAHDGTVLRHSASAAAVMSAASSAGGPGTQATALALPPPPPPPGPRDDAPPLVRSLSAPDLPLQPAIRKKPSAEVPIIEEEADDADAEETPRPEEEPLQPPPPPPTQLPPPTRSPPSLPPDTAHTPAAQGGSSYEFIFGSEDAPLPPPTLGSSAAALWAAKRAEAPPPPPPPPTEPEEQPPPPQPAAAKDVALGKKPAAAEDVALGKKPAVDAGARRALTQKTAMRKADGKKGRTARLGEILHDLDDHFLRASDSAHEVSKMLEATRMHYHSNFTETRGFVDHSARVMQVITWNRSFKGIPQPENVKNELDDDEAETHGTVLEKLLAWEKKLCHEVKEFEVIKMEYQQKLAVLNKKKQRGVSSSSLEKTKSAASHLHTKYVVDLQTIESTCAEINRLRDRQLYPKLLELVKGMGQMWDAMYTHHKAQLKIILELKSFDISVAARETSEQHNERTVQLWNIVQEWHSQYDKFMRYQKEYVGNLYSWIKLNVIPIDNDMKPKSSQPLEITPPIKRLLHAWHDILGKLPDEAAKNAIHTFGEVIHTILVHQEDELKLKIKIDDARKEHDRKRRQFEDWAMKYMEKRAGIPPEASNPDGTRADPLVERTAAVERLKDSLKDMDEQYLKQCKLVREKSLSLLRKNLPELFQVVSDFSLQSAAMFKSLWSIANTNDQLDE